MENNRDMNPKIYYTIFALFFAVCGCATPAVRENKPSEIQVKEDAPPKLRIAVLPVIDGVGERSQAFRDEVRSQLVKALGKTKAVVLIDPKEIKKEFVVKQGEFELNDFGKDATQLGISAVIEPKIVDLKFRRKSDEVGVFRSSKSEIETAVRVRVVAVRNVRELLNQSRTRRAEKADTQVGQLGEKKGGLDQEVLIRLTGDAFEDLIPEIIASLEQINWEGRVALVNGDRVFLNVGRISGLQVGDILKVIEEGEEVFDPDSGNLIGRVPGRLKGTIEVVSFFGNDGSIAVIHSGSAFKENDRVELY